MKKGHKLGRRGRRRQGGRQTKNKGRTNFNITKKKRRRKRTAKEGRKKDTF